MTSHMHHIPALHIATTCLFLVHLTACVQTEQCKTLIMLCHHSNVGDMGNYPAQGEHEHSYGSTTSLLRLVGALLE